MNAILCQHCFNILDWLAVLSHLQENVPAIPLCSLWAVGSSLFLPT